MSPSLQKFKSLNMSARMKFMKNSCKHPAITRTKKEVLRGLSKGQSEIGFFDFNTSPEGFEYWWKKLS